MVVPQSACFGCKHFNREKPESMTCAAFPDGIPEEIAAGTVMHRRPYPGDHGITYEPLTRTAAKHYRAYERDEPGPEE